MGRAIFIFALIAILALWSGTVAGAEDSPGFAEQLAALAAKCDELGLAAQAQITRDWIVSRHPGRQYLFLPDADSHTWPKAGSTEVERQWHGRFIELRKQHAGGLFASAQQASDEGQPTRAYQLLHEVLREDPDHAQARRVLGYVQRGRDWRLPGEASAGAQRPRAAETKLGWAAGSYWRLETPHFAIVTNHSAKEALELGRQLEELHALWRQVFFQYWSSPEALAARFAGRDEPLARPRPRMNVVLVKTRAEYLAQLAASVPQIDRTVGIYLNRQRKSFFYAGDTSVYPTWHHEATHQLFQEAVAGTLEQPGEERNFWVIEGAALYMESLARREGYWTVGGCESDRMQFARYRALTGDFSLPLAELSSLGREPIQTSPDIARIYAQAAGVTHFLIDGEKGKHREALVDLLAVVYRGADQPLALAELTGIGLGELDQQYRRFLDVTDADLAGIPNPAAMRNLSLGRTSVTDAGLAHLAGCQALEWLDLSATQVGDAGLAHLAGATKLKQLFLEGTKITDASLSLVGRIKALEELDLSRLPGIGDEGLAALAGLKHLKILHLSGSPIGDAGLVHLRGLKQLESLETTGTEITPDGLQKLQAALPKLKGS